MSRVNFRGKMISPVFAVDELKTEKAAETAIAKWQKLVTMHEQLANDELDKVANYKRRIQLAKAKFIHKQ